MRNEYPRPDFVRPRWQSLNGLWQFGEGDQVEPGRTIEVPFAPQSALSGAGGAPTSNEITYERTFRVPPEWAGQRVLLHFGAVDYQCGVFLNGHCLGSHRGGQTPFSFDITDCLTGGEERLTVRAVDYLTDECIPRGKQFWQEKGQFIWYTQCSGIWQSVWLEPVPAAHIQRLHFTPDIDKGTVEIAYQVSDDTPCPFRLGLDIRFGDRRIYSSERMCSNRRGRIFADVFENKALRGSFHFTGWYWSPEHPSLFDVTAKLCAGDSGTDEVQTYFGMRKIHVENGRVFLNNQPYYQKLLLDQGYWRDGLMTAPSEEDYIQDIKLAKAMGFNGCRKHEKVEDPLFLYWADKLGFLVWESMASFWSFTPQGAAAFAGEWSQVILRDYSHPSIVVWNMLNESWGLPRLYDDPQQQHFAQAMYHLAKGLDGTRLVIANDGWELTENDICAFHSYKHGGRGDLRQQEIFRRGVTYLAGLERLVERPLFAKGFGYRDQPVMLTEIGGIRLLPREGEKEEGWGYTGAAGAAEFLAGYRRLVGNLYDSELICGFCYTQLADIQQEKNGLLDELHRPKVAPEKLREINDRMETTGTFYIETEG